MVAADLIAPKGRVEESFFPELSSAQLQERLTEYLEQAYDAADAASITAGSRDAAAAHWTYSRVFDALYLAIIANPLSSATPEGGSASFSLAQAEEFRRLAAEEKGFYDALIPMVIVPDPVITQGQTVAVSNQFNW